MNCATENLDGPSPDALARRFRFETLYADWLRARATRCDPSLPEDDETADARGDAYEEAERALVMTPAPHPFCVWWKWEVLALQLKSPTAPCTPTTG